MLRNLLTVALSRLLDPRVASTRLGLLSFTHVKRRLADMSIYRLKVLNVAEKNDVAKNVSNILSGGSFQRREGFSVYNKVYDFSCEVPSLRFPCDMIMTSVSGHLLNYEFTQAHASWRSCDPKVLFNAPIVQGPSELNGNKIKSTLEREAAKCSVLIIWTDCDREGENIGFEVIRVCQAKKPNIRVLRARFSEITVPAINRAIRNLVPPDQRISDAVDVRQQLDLRIGAAFTRFLTMGIQNVSSAMQKNVVSYGSCQFPTLGFVVDQWKKRENFIPEDFWYIDVEFTRDNITCSFNWKRVRLFDERSVLAIFSKIMEKPTAQVTNLTSRQKTKYRPIAMDTVTFERLASSKLRINAKRAMTIAEKLYTSGFISYPRTETNKFPPDMSLNTLVGHQKESPEWGQFATRLLNFGGATPRNGNKSDQAHPPIHPTKYAGNLTGDDKKVYELIARHFLACCDRDALGHEVTVEATIEEEVFILKGLEIQDRNYLEVYIYEKWHDKEIPKFTLNETFTPDSIMMNTGKTCAPELLTESQLIALMEKHGIGTDATHAEHIEKIKLRNYITVTPDRRLKPEGLGIGLCEGYDEIGYAMSKPHLRAALEVELQQICSGTKTPGEVLRNQLTEYEKVFEESTKKRDKLFQEIVKHF